MHILFKLTELLHSCSKQIINIFQLSQSTINMPMEKNDQGNCVYKKPCVLKEKWKAKLNYEHLF